MGQKAGKESTPAPSSGKKEVPESKAKSPAKLPAKGQLTKKDLESTLNRLHAVSLFPNFTVAAELIDPEVVKKLQEQTNCARFSASSPPFQRRLPCISCCLLCFADSFALPF